MKVYGKTIDFKHTRLEDAKRFEKAVSNMADANEKYKKTGHSMSESIPVSYTHLTLPTNSLV